VRTGCLGRERGRQRVRVDLEQREVLPDEAHPTVGTLDQRTQDGGRGPAARALEVAVLDDRDRRVEPSEHVPRVVGQVRDHDPDADGQVTALEYSAHPDAGSVLRRICTELASDPEVLGLAVTHRTGSLVVGDLAIVACVATAHRALEFDVCRELVERVKTEVPIWKRQQLADGAHTWVGL
jgi:molybdopterin synthase catalytic subunit